MPEYMQTHRPNCDPNPLGTRNVILPIVVRLSFLLSITVVFTIGCKTGSEMRNIAPNLIPNPLKIAHRWHESFEKATEESHRTGKPILVNFTGSDWCHWCVKLKSDIFETDTFGKWADQNVVLLNLDFPRRSNQAASIQQQNKDLAARYQISAYPTVLLLDSQGNLLGQLGYLKEPPEWIAKADEILARQQ